MKKYEVTIAARSGKEKDNIHYDMEASDYEDARRKVYRYLEGSNKLHLFSEITLAEIPNGPLPIGIRFSYQDTLIGKKFSQYLIVKAESKEQAKEYYEKNFLGRHFYQPWPDKIDEAGKCIYGSVEDTYYAACPGYHFDATKI